MFKAERLQKIKNLVNNRKQMDVASLSLLLNVTEVTIRSDLEQLEKEGFLRRLHGGAVLNDRASGVQPINDLLSGHTIVYEKAKETVAVLAAGMIDNADCVFLGGGETCYYIAKELLNHNRLTVFTNNLYVANVLSFNTKINLTLSGGQLSPTRTCRAGKGFHFLTEDLFFNKAIFSVAGVDTLAGYTLNNADEVEVFHTISAHSKQVIIVADHNKFDNMSFIKLGDLDLCTTVLTDCAVPQPYSDYYDLHQVELIMPGKKQP